MKTNTTKKRWIPVVVGICAGITVRLVRVRMPNVEPIMALQLPFAKTNGPLVGFVFGTVSIVGYDILTGTLGIWTVLTASVYGVVGLVAAYFFRNRSMNSKNITSFVVASTLFYDALTGLTIGPLFFHQSFTVAFVGQIPFTLMHLFGNVTFSLILSPSIAAYLTERQRRSSAQESPLSGLVSIVHT